MKRHIVDASANAVDAISRPELVDLLEVVGLDRFRVDLDCLTGLIILEPQHAFEWKYRLGFIKDVKNDQVVTCKPQPMNGLQDRSGLAQEIAEEHDQAPVADHSRNLMQAAFDVSGSRWRKPGQE